MSSYASLISAEGHITVVAAGKQWYIRNEDENHDAVLQALRDKVEEEELIAIMDREKPVKDWLEASAFNGSGAILVEQGMVFYQDRAGVKEELHGTMVDRLLVFVREDLPYEPLLLFINNLMQNTCWESIQELFDFLDHKCLPITEDGCFLAHKAVTWNYRDKWTGTKDNSVGQTVSEPRRKVCNDRKQSCAPGLHAGTLRYVQQYGNFYKDVNGFHTDESDRVVIVKINPKHVVSVPSVETEKLRCEEYTVVGDYLGDEMEYVLATANGVEYTDDDSCPDCGELDFDCTCDDCDDCGQCADECECHYDQEY